MFTEKDWCGDNLEAYRGSWTEDRIPENRDLAYAMAKANTERMIYQAAEQDGSFDRDGHPACARDRPADERQP